MKICLFYTQTGTCPCLCNQDNLSAFCLQTKQIQTKNTLTIQKVAKSINTVNTRLDAHFLAVQKYHKIPCGKYVKNL